MELKRHGFDDLADVVMESGGPYIIGAKVGIDWEEPIEVFDESLRSVRVESYALDSRGELLLGDALGSKLDADAAALDMAALKRELEIRNQEGGNDYEEQWSSSSSSSSSSSLSYEGEEYNDIAFKQKFERQTQMKKKNAKWVPVDENVTPKGERFTLDASKRIYLSFVAAAITLAHGHTSVDIVERGIGGDVMATVISFSNVASSALIAASLTSAFASIQKAQEKKRNVFVWGMKGILGGPLAVRDLTTLPSLEEK
jgi:hypothetical protein